MSNTSQWALLIIFRMRSRVDQDLGLNQCIKLHKIAKKKKIVGLMHCLQMCCCCFWCRFRDLYLNRPLSFIRVYKCSLTSVKGLYILTSMFDVEVTIAPSLKLRVVTFVMFVTCCLQCLVKMNHILQTAKTVPTQRKM